MESKKAHSVTRKDKRLLLLACGGMQCCWLYAWAVFFMLVFVQRPYPLLEAFGTFGLAAVLTAHSQGKGWRIIQLFGLQLCGIVLAVLKTIHAFYYPSYVFLNRRWLLEFFQTPRATLEGFVLIVLLVWVLVFWSAGVMLIRKPVAYSTIGSRFDLGIVALLGVLLLKIPIQTELKLDMSLLEHLLFPFFLFSLLALGLARNRSDAQKDFLAGYQGLGVILSFAAMVLLGGAGIVALFLPYMTRTAETAYVILKTGTAPLLPYIEKLLRFIFGSARFRVEPPTNPAGSPVEYLSPDANSEWFGGAGAFLNVIFWGLGVLTILLLLVTTFKLLWPWLLLRTALEASEDEPGALRGTWIRKLGRVLLLCWDALGRQFSGYRRVTQLYAALLRWGRYSGMAHRADETPLEFGARLKHCFPEVSREIDLIIEAFHQEIYAEDTLDSHQLAAAQEALRTLRSPTLWVSRLKTSFS